MNLKGVKNRIILWVGLVFTGLLSHGQIVNGADQPEAYLPLLEGKKVAVVCNQTSTLKTYEHLVDFLVKNKIDVVKVFAPEHGFRGTASAGEEIKSGVDGKTGLPIVSLYGKNKKPSAEMLLGVDAVLFDIQDVGARFYTYISTMSLVMEACAEQDLFMVVLDRPNPNGYYVDGPVLEPGFESFVGMHQIPIVHGMTVGEYAQMVNGEGWLGEGLKCALAIISVQNYSHKTSYDLPISPSPNLPNKNAIRLYPSLCFFEGTNVSVGRGSAKPFQQIGAPWMDKVFPEYKFVPEPNEGAKSPMYKGEDCYGVDLSSFANSFLPHYNQIYLFWLLQSYEASPNKDAFFNNYFDKLAGTDLLRKQIIAGISEEEIRASWQEDLIRFKQMRRKYLLYPDFE